ncbi:synembryn isoform X2 [Harpegnathos saltator]|uniref:Synembryn-A n=2 Tax=Harpegnathos saltator TaxID=610380 RepID=E2BFK7_HARSA|nr:synembryn isoform X2 [Harpegnathos saltator]XP_025159284.1 synembryn isoform X2 [Harpegnathos saltator]XP_025159285.1 synembryn isoform X2 [Harpegnathos saltator]EFN85529.1 Synembryn-A [Harpegnathos saltator]
MEKTTADKLIPKLISGTYEEFCENIIVFLDTYNKKTSFDELNSNCLREKLWKMLFHHLTNQMYIDHRHHCLAALRILSRDKTNLDELITDNAVKIILLNTGLTKIYDEEQISYTVVMIESLKLLCNLLFNSVKMQQSKVLISSLPYLMDRVRNYTNDTPYDVKLFDMRILFLITALNTSTRNIIKHDLCGDVCLIKIIEDFVTRNQDNNETTIIKTEEITVICEVLKVLFNLYIQSDDTGIEDQEKHKNLMLILYKLLILKYSMQQDDLESNVINLLTVILYSCYTPIIQPVKYNDRKSVYQGMDMSAICVLLRFLDQRLDCKTHLIENISPVVTALIRLVKSERIIRKYVRLQILPPLKDVMNRPEEGTTLRAKLCKLLTSPLIELRDLVAELLFILCKENVNRMVKYTGYGNAAGMFAKKGLLGRNQAETAYSSESEDSETEEYLKYKEQINPVTGCFEHPKPNPLEGMTEEQKEFEALQLVDLVDKLTREGVVRPCRIGEDGKPKPIEHVLELQSELPKQQYSRKDSDSE